MKRPKFLAYLVLTFAILLLLCLYSGARLQAGRRAVTQAARDLDVCRQLAVQINSLKEGPAVVGQVRLDRSELVRRMESAATAAGLGTANLVSVTPEAPRRVGGSVYQEKLTQLVIKQVSLPQLVTFLYVLCTKNPGLSIPRVRIASHQNLSDNQAGRWTAEATISYLMYDPQSPSDTSRGSDHEP